MNTFVQDQLEAKLLGNIQKQANQVNKLENIKLTHQVVHQIKQVYSCFEKIKYCYDFDIYKIVDYVSLSEAMADTNCLSLLTPEIKQIPSVNKILIKIGNAKGQLIQQTKERFDNAFNLKDEVVLNECIIVFFNIEILRDQI